MCQDSQGIIETSSINQPAWTTTLSRLREFDVFIPNYIPFWKKKQPKKHDRRRRHLEADRYFPGEAVHQSTRPIINPECNAESKRDTKLVERNQSSSVLRASNLALIYSTSSKVNRKKKKRRLILQSGTSMLSMLHNAIITGPSVSSNSKHYPYPRAAPAMIRPISKAWNAFAVI